MQNFSKWRNISYKMESLHRKCLLKIKNIDRNWKMFVGNQNFVQMGQLIDNKLYN